MRMTTGRVPAVLCLLGCLLLSPNAAADTIRLAGGLTDTFGTLDQNDVDACKDAMGTSFSCGPTAAVNSFVMLQNLYPAIYGNELVPDVNGNGLDAEDLEAVANILAGKDYMDCVAMNLGGSQGGFEGVSLENFIKGKRKYIEEKVPGVTIYKAQSEFLPMAMVDDRHKQRPPSFDFMFRELAHGEDVEIVVGRYQRPAMGPPIRLSGHVLTLTKLEWHDEGPGGIGDFQFGLDDFATMTFIDPLGGIEGTATIHLLGDRLATDYDAAGAGNLRAIDAVVSESPGAVPEPGATLLLAWGLYAYAARRRPKDLKRDR